MAWSGSEFDESMPNTRTQTTSCNLLLQTYICVAELATWDVGPDVYVDIYMCWARNVTMYTADIVNAGHKMLIVPSHMHMSIEHESAIAARWRMTSCRQKSTLGGLRDNLVH